MSTPCMRFGMVLIMGWLCGVHIAISAPPNESDAQYQSYLSHLAAANSALRLHETSEAKRWLTQTPGDRSTWEWRWLRRQSDTSLRRFDTGTWSPVRVEYSPDGDRIAIAGGDGKVRILGSEDLAVRLEIETGLEAVYAARFNADGSRIATCNRDGKIAVWSATTGERVWEQSSGGEGLADLAWHPRGEQLAFVSWFRGPKTVLGLVSMWNAATGERTWNCEFGVKPIVVVKFSPDGSKLAAGTWDGIVGIWDSTTLAPPQELNFQDLANYSAIDDIAFSPDGERLAAASKNGSPRIWNLKSGEIERDLRGHGGAVFATAFADRSILFSGGTDGVVGVWDTTRGELVDRFFGHDNRIASIAVRPNGRELATCSADRTIRVWKLATDDSFEDADSSKYDYGMTLSHDGRLLATGGQSPTVVTVWDATTGKPLRRLSGLEGSINYLEFGPDDLLVGGNWSSDLLVWNAATGEVVRALEKHDLGGVQQCAFSANGAWIAASMRNNLVAIWDARTGALSHRLPLATACWGIDFSGDSSRLAVGDAGGKLHLFACGTWREDLTLPGVDSQINALKFSPDDRHVACGGENGRLVVFDPESKSIVHSVEGHSQRIWTLDFLENGSRLATGGADHKVRLWDVVTGSPVLTIAEFTEPIYNLVFSKIDETLFVNATRERRALRVPTSSE